MESLNSIYIKTTTLRYLRKYDKNKFVEVCSLLLKNSNPYHTKFEKDIIQHLAKQVRNRYFNSLDIKQLGYKKKVYKNQLSIAYPPPLSVRNRSIQ